MKRLACGTLLVMMLAMAARADLLEYVARPDPTYAWSKLGEDRLENGVTLTELSMTSQTWHDIAWKHKLLILRPARMDKPSEALLLITGGIWEPGDENRPAARRPRELETAAAVAESTRRPVAILMYVPYQPILNNLREDQAISYTFIRYITTGEADWPLLLPMTKAAVRAMDTVQAFAKQEWQQEVTGFVVGGASKRGWTTYLAAVADRRVKAMAPVVFDTLDMPAQMKHQLETWGQYSEQIGDYTALGLQKLLDTPAGRTLTAMVDPYSYRKKLTAPKLIILSTNDRYWPLDALNLYWPNLEGEKRILYLPNARHGFYNIKPVMADLSALLLEAAGQFKFPRLTWDLQEDPEGLKLAIRSDVKPEGVSVWTSKSATRDFREARWSSQPLTANGNEYTFALPKPREGLAAGFGEVVYKIENRPLYLSTNVRIIGTTRPAEEEDKK